MASEREGEAEEEELALGGSFVPTRLEIYAHLSDEDHFHWPSVSWIAPMVNGPLFGSGTRQTWELSVDFITATTSHWHDAD